jgi:hypothetical protein
MYSPDQPEGAVEVKIHGKHCEANAYNHPFSKSLRFDIIHSDKIYQWKYHIIFPGLQSNEI